MASFPFLSSLTKGREPLTGSKRIIVLSAVGLVFFFVSSAWTTVFFFVLYLL